MSESDGYSNKFPDADEFPVKTLLVRIYRRGFDAGGLTVDLGSGGLVRVTEVKINGMDVDPSFGSGVKFKPPEGAVFRIEHERYGAEARLHRLRTMTTPDRDDPEPL